MRKATNGENVSCMPSFRARSAAAFPAASNGEFNLPTEMAIVLARGNGCEVWDTDGRRYIDFSLGWGSVLVGHAHPAVVRAVTEQAPRGSNFSYVNDQSLALAEELIRLSPACELVRFCASGTEATFYCLRLARAFSRRGKVLKFEGAYHGAHDVGVTSLFPKSQVDFPLAQPSSAGLEASTSTHVLIAPYNDLETAGRILEQNAEQIAAVIIEPLQRCTPPVPGFLAGLRELTQRLDILLIFDEVVTGFRLAYGGAQEYYGVTPDLVAYGKALGGGYPIGAFGGRADVMAQVTEDKLGTPEYVWTASTLGGNPISCAAASAALNVLAAEGIYPRLHQMGEYFRDGLRRELKQAGEIAQVIGQGPLAQVIFTPREIRNYRDVQTADSAKGRRLMLELFSRGIFLNPMGTKLYLSLAHREQDCDEFLSIFAQVLRAIAA
jgi:glutamate-1-semialdehyde 2,1-aminomutase